MCLILFAARVSKDYPLIFAANRDEFHQRPTAPIHFWSSNGDILAGKDLKGGGTWFAVHETGRFAALTNFRNPQENKPEAPSRGDIIINFLTSSTPCDQYFNERAAAMTLYNGFNLLFGDKDQTYWFSNITGRSEKIELGIHGLSNKDLDTPWPKVVNGKKNLERVLQSGASMEKLFSVLADTKAAPDERLPDTGVGIEWERLLSPIFIRDKVYGTRSSTVMMMNAAGRIQIIERTYDHFYDNTRFTDRCFHITPQAIPPGPLSHSIS